MKAPLDCLMETLLNFVKIQLCDIDIYFDLVSCAVDLISLKKK